VDEKALHEVVWCLLPLFGLDNEATTTTTAAAKRTTTTTTTTTSVVVHDITVPAKIDPTVAHSLWKKELLPDFEGAPNHCRIKDGPNGKLLNIVQLATEEELKEVVPVKLFCGTYTMEKNHDGNVKTLRSTWAKRCDGWVAFSTADDPSLPALSIPHEGEESYDNMWQKSRAIWRYIGAHYMEDFDWFLLGGDDMYYIVENLRYYLGSAQVQEAAAEVI
jgi:hypothetical protein